MDLNQDTGRFSSLLEVSDGCQRDGVLSVDLNRDIGGFSPLLELLGCFEFSVDLN